MTEEQRRRLIRALDILKRADPNAAAHMPRRDFLDTDPCNQAYAIGWAIGAITDVLKKPKVPG